VAACPGRSTGCFRNNNPDEKFLCNVCAQKLSELGAINPDRPDETGLDAIIKVAAMFDAGDSAGYQAVFASWLPILRQF
jgi:hypothetical protein